MSLTVVEALTRASERLGDRREATALLKAVLGVDMSVLIGWPESILDAVSAARFYTWLDRRAAGEPLAYLTGEKEFWSLSLQVTHDTLIPRPETERLIELVIERMPENKHKVLDLGTGSGAIAIALAVERPNWQITATDQSEAALAIARLNSARYQTPITFYQGD
jgi:release factor glutamine methyltransferase